jgi:hypothetical protein
MILSTGLTTLIWYFTAWSSGGGAAVLLYRLRLPDRAGPYPVLKRRSGDMGDDRLCGGLPLPICHPAARHRFSVLIAVLGCVLLPFGLMMAMNLAGMLIRLHLRLPRPAERLCRRFQPELQTLNASLAGLLIACGCLCVQL